MVKKVQSPMVKNLSVLLEKTGATFVEVFLTAWVAADALSLDTAQAAGVAGITAALTVLANGVEQFKVSSSSAWGDIAARTIRTYVAAFLGFLLATPVLELGVSGLQSAALAAIPAGLTVLKGGFSSLVGNVNSGALLPESLDLK